MTHPLKQRLLPAYNATIHKLRLWGDHLRAYATANLGVCDVCGRFGPRLYRRRVVPPRLVTLWGLSPRLAKSLARKESSDCSHCGAKLRAMRLARVILQEYPNDPPTPCLRDWARSPQAKGLRIAEFNTIEGVHQALSPWIGLNLESTDFDPNATPGEVINGVRSEDLTRLTYPSESFDLVLTSETLEHVPDLRQALREIQRVLVPNGRHLFTVPVLPTVATTFPRARLRHDGSIEALGTMIHHPGGDAGYPVFTEIGLDFPAILESEGFETSIVFGPIRVDDICQVFVCRKR